MILVAKLESDNLLFRLLIVNQLNCRELLKLMRVAVIDMGTNTFHLLIVDVIEEDFKVLYREKIAVRIGKDGINKGLITSDAWERALNTLKTFKSVTQDFEVDEIYATATSAIRNAKNGKDLVNAINKETGISTRIISGIEEAEYIYFGVKRAMKIGEETALIMDIGGGSIEFILASDNQIHWLQSFEIGGQRMVEQFHHHDPIIPEELSNLENYIFEKLQPLFDAIAKHQPSTLIGSSGTFDTLSEIHCHKKNISIDPELTEFPLTVASFEEIFQDLVSKNREERLQIKGMIPLRVDMIVVATATIKYIIDTCGLEKIRVSAFALKEGVLLKTIDQLQKDNRLAQKD